VKKTFLEISIVKLVVKKMVYYGHGAIEVGHEKVSVFGFWMMAWGLVMGLAMVSD
jgi:hypothetical protein